MQLCVNPTGLFSSCSHTYNSLKKKFSFFLIHLNDTETCTRDEKRDTMFAWKFCTFCCGIFQRLNTLDICNWNPNLQWWNLYTQRKPHTIKTEHSNSNFLSAMIQIRIYGKKTLKLYSVSVLLPPFFGYFVVQFELINIFAKEKKTLLAVDDNFINLFSNVYGVA